jgi:hypothetical protein
MAIYSNIYGTVEFQGIEIPLIGKARIGFNNRSFDHLFGVEKVGEWIVEDITDIDIRGGLGKLMVNNRISSVSSLPGEIADYVESLTGDAFTDDDRNRAIDSAEKISL